jgi:hypothetical protein
MVELGEPLARFHREGIKIIHGINTNPTRTKYKDSFNRELILPPCMFITEYTPIKINVKSIDTILRLEMRVILGGINDGYQRPS